jgi:tetratricopeptide (TPR) repeat protein
LEAESDATRVTALGELATLEAFGGNAEEADRVSAAALAEAQALDLADPVLTELLIIRGLAHAIAGRPTQAAASLREAARRAEASRDSAAAARALLNLGNVIVSTDPQAAVQANRDATAHGKRIGHLYALATSVTNLVQALLMTGEWTEARQVCQTASEDGLGDDPVLAYSAALLHALSGEAAKLEPLLTTVAQLGDSEDPQDRSATAAAFAAAVALAGDHAEALRQAQAVLEHADAIGYHSDAVRWAWPIAADAALALGDEAAVERLLGRLLQLRPGHVPPVLRAESQRVRARLLAGRADRSAVEAFDAAVQAFRQLGSPYHLAVALLDQADYLAETNGVQAAGPLAAEAEDIAGRLGALPLLERAGRLAGADVQPRRPAEAGRSEVLM